MKISIIFFILGSGLIATLGNTLFGFSWQDAAWCVFGANVGTFCSIQVILWMQSRELLQKLFTSSVSKTWVVFLTLSLGIASIIAPGFQDPKQFTILAIPAMLSSSISVLVFGPIRDEQLRRRAQRLKEKA